jgi:hypothetical protein
MSSTFSFTNPDSEYSHKICSNVILHLRRTNHAVAILSFTDEMGNKVDVPTVFRVYTKDYQTNKEVIQKPIDNIYALCWSDNYTIAFNNQTILEIKNNRNWDILQK